MIMSVTGSQKMAACGGELSTCPQRAVHGRDCLQRTHNLVKQTPHSMRPQYTSHSMRLQVMEVDALGNIVFCQSVYHPGSLCSHLFSSTYPYYACLLFFIFY